MNYTQLDIHSFKEAIQETATFKKIGNSAIQKLYFKRRSLETLYENYRQACRYGINYLKQKPSLQGRDVSIIEEVINNQENDN